MIFLDWLITLNPFISGLVLSILLGLPTGLSVIETFRSLENDEEKEVDTWDSEWDLK